MYIYIYTIVFLQSCSAIEQPLKEATPEGKFVVMSKLPTVKCSSGSPPLLSHSSINITHKLILHITVSVQKR